MKRIRTILATALLALAAAGAAQAQPLHLRPGSALVFPYIDSTKGVGTIVCVTNTNSDRTYCEDEDYRAGDVVLHYLYVDGEDWTEFDRYELLTPGDNFCTIVGRHNPEGGKGFLIVTAVNPTDYSERIKFDYLIGSATIAESGGNRMWSYTPYVFLGAPQAGTPAACTRVSTDITPDGDMAFDGVEYSSLPGLLYLDSFFEESGVLTGKLVLMSLAGSTYTNELSLLIWNNDEVKFSRTLKFTCWTSTSIGEISEIAKDLGGNDGEGGLPIQTGWIRFEPRLLRDQAGNARPDLSPVLGVFRESMRKSFAAGRALQYDVNVDPIDTAVVQ